MASLFFLHFTVLELETVGGELSKRESEPFYINDEGKFWYTVKFLAELLTRENAPAEERLDIITILSEMAFGEYRRMILLSRPLEKDAHIPLFAVANTHDQTFRFFQTLAEKVTSMPAGDFATWFLGQLKKPKFSGLELVA